MNALPTTLRILRRAMLLLLVFTATAQARDVTRSPLHCSVEGEAGKLEAALCASLERRLKRPVQRTDVAVPRGESVRFVRDDVHWTVVWSVSGRARAWVRLSRMELTSRPLVALAHTAVRLSTARPCDPHERSAECASSFGEVLDPWPEAKRATARRLSY